MTLSTATVAGLTRQVLSDVDMGRCTAYSFVNPHGYNGMAGDQQYLHELQSMDAVFADGIGVVWTARALARTVVEQLSFDLLAEELFPALASAGIPVFLLGGARGVAEGAAQALRTANPKLNVVGTAEGFFGTDYDLDRVLMGVNDSGARVLVVGTGAPLQERIALAARCLEPPVVSITCGGYFDQVTQRQYYPTWAYPLHLNWLVRLAREPRRLWRRYLLGIPQFIVGSVAWYLRGGGR